VVGAKLTSFVQRERLPVPRQALGIRPAGQPAVAVSGEHRAGLDGVVHVQRRGVVQVAEDGPHDPPGVALIHPAEPLAQVRCDLELILVLAKLLRQPRPQPVAGGGDELSEGVVGQRQRKLLDVGPLRVPLGCVGDRQRGQFALPGAFDGLHDPVGDLPFHHADPGRVGQVGCLR
jgi:hypothetical protein